jgi:hypothetical protein
VAAVDHSAQDHHNIEKGPRMLKDLRGEKLTEEERDMSYSAVGDKKKVAHATLREYSNAGGFNKRLFDAND